MQELLFNGFHVHLRENHPELVLQLQEEGQLQPYLHSAVQSVEGMMNALLEKELPVPEVEQQCLEQLQKTLPPSKYNFLKELLEAAFPERYASLLECGLLTTELINLITYCDPVFEGLGFEEDDAYLRYMLIGTVSDYFEMMNEVKEA